MGSLSRRSFLACSLGLVGAFGLTGCGTNRQQEADDLFEDEEYEQALAIYEELESTDEIEEKKSQCRFWLFIEYLRDEGGVDTSTTDGTGQFYETEVEAKANGDIRIVYHTYTVVQGPDSDFEYTIDIDHEDGTAEVSGVYELSDPDLGTAKQTGDGTFDIGNYSYGDPMSWDETTDVVTLSSGLQTSLGVDTIGQTSATCVDTSVRALADAAEESDTGCSMADIGFTNLQDE